MEDKTITLEYLIGLLQRHFFGIVVCICICLEGSILAIMYLPKKYKSTAVLNIHSSYFKSPLVSDLISEITDPSELSAQRQSLLRLALDDQFLDGLGEKYGLFKHSSESELQTVERELLLKRIEYFSLSATSFQISIGASDSYQAYNMTKEVLEQMTFTLIEERYQILVKARDAIQTQVEFLNRALKDSQSGNQTQYLQNELDKINGNINSLRQKFTESHPDLLRLREKAKTLKSRMRGRPAVAALEHDDFTGAFAIPSSKQPIQDIYNDLLKKLSHLNIVLQMENDRDNVSYLAVIEQPRLAASPYFPKKRVVLTVGLVVGLVLGLVQAVFYELRKLTRLTPELAARSMQVPFLGELPALPKQDSRLLLGGAVPRKALPFRGVD